MKYRISKKILLEFLKKNKLMGNMFVCAHAKPMYEKNYNMRLITNNLEKADKTPSFENVRNILGLTYSPLKSPAQLYSDNYKGDLMYEIYKKWEKYITENWEKINEHYKNQ